jgi:hypothetical protein
MTSCRGDHKGLPYSLLYIRLEHIGSVNVPERDTWCIVECETVQRKLSITNNIIEVIALTQGAKRIQSFIWWLAITTFACKNTMYEMRKLLEAVEL